ncbi:neuronal cell adhesion molecule a isoform X3 [Hippocampus zosterae]|uniref:neuronal cell adhesion molecule a isoform X3 n=1 Tax=Hippocampus zosterae TaxID=109293 RepID=UPI00223D8BD9|nr:neuronal cell adhesion molecule a isoform X3 [Hippocampus zosterae]
MRGSILHVSAAGRVGGGGGSVEVRTTVCCYCSGREGRTREAGRTLPSPSAPSPPASRAELGRGKGGRTPHRICSTLSGPFPGRATRRSHPDSKVRPNNMDLAVPRLNAGETPMTCVGSGAVLLVMLVSHVASALEVPLDPKVLEGLPQPPTITLQSPKDYIFDPRENIVIHCEAKGKPHPSFSWTRNGSHFDVEQDSKVLLKPGSGTLIIDISGEKAEAYEGTYRCAAHNDHGTAVSNDIVIRQSRSPLWSKERLEAITVQVGVSMVLPCRPPAGLPPPVIFWMDNIFQKLPLDNRVSQALNGDLYFSNVLPEDSRNDYICYARFPNTQTIQQKQPISVTVLQSKSFPPPPPHTPAQMPSHWLFSLSSRKLANPTVECHPGFMTPLGAASSKTVLRGDTLELECIAEGLPTPEMSWQKDGVELPSSRVSFLNYKKTLKIADVGEADAGDYTCAAANRLGAAHHVIKVAVKAAPFWISAPRNLILAPNETGILTCRVSGDPKPDISWFVNGVPIENAPEDPARKVDGDTVILSRVQSGSSAVYQCNASNEFGYLLANAFVSVLAEPPRILTPPDRVYQVITNSPALLHCATFGSPIPTITWFKDSLISIKSEDPYVIHENGTLEINVAQSQNSGKYTCMASNNLGVKENHLFLEVKEPTRILKQPEYKVAQRGTSAVFQCKVKHDPSLVPTMTWLKNAGELPDDERWSSSAATRTCNSATAANVAQSFSPPLVRFEVDTDSLVIKDVTEEDEGTYTCVMNTTLDRDSASATLTVVEATPTPAIFYEKPDPPTDLKLTDQTERSVQLTWFPGDEHNSPTQKFLIQYEDLLHRPGVWVNLTEVAGTSATAQLELSPYVYYSFRVLAKNQVGYSRASQPSRQYRTNPAAPDENPSDVQGKGTEPGNLLISWTSLTGLQSNGPGLEYKVLWRQMHVDQDWSSQTVANASHLVVSGLPVYVPYEIKVQALNDYGNGPEAEVVIGYSGEDLPSSAPDGVLVTVHNSTTAQVHWEPVSPHSVRGKLKGYKVYYRRQRGLHETEEEADQESEEQVVTFSGNRSEGRLPGLQAYSLYIIFIRVLNSKGEGPRSRDKQFETPEGVPGPPSFLNVLNPNLDSLTLEWGPPLHKNGRLIGYVLQYQPVLNITEAGPVTVMDFPVNETTVTLDNLNSSVLYKFQLSAKTVKGAGANLTKEASTIVESSPTEPPPHPTSPVTRSAHPPPHKAPSVGPVFGIVNTSVSEECALITWEYFGHHKNIYVEYTVENSKEDWKKESVNGSRSHILKGLKPGTSYRVRVVARDPAGPTLHVTNEEVVTVPAVASRHVDIATQGWFIGLMCAIALLILVLLIVCFIKRNKGGKYPVKEKEEAHQDPEIQPMKEDDGTFGEYSDTEDHKPLKGSRTPSNGTVRRDESDDSLVDYGEGGDGQFNEDGSFIGQYSGKKEKDTHEGNESSEAPSPVNAMNSFV